MKNFFFKNVTDFIKKGVCHMSSEQFKNALMRLLSHRGSKERAVFCEMLEHFFPEDREGVVRRVHAEAYEVDGTTVIVSKLGSKNTRCLLVDYETGKLLCKE